MAMLACFQYSSNSTNPVFSVSADKPSADFYSGLPTTVYWLSRLVKKTSPGPGDPGPQHNSPPWYLDNKPPAQWLKNACPPSTRKRVQTKAKMADLYETAAQVYSMTARTAASDKKAADVSGMAGRRMISRPC